MLRSKTLGIGLLGVVVAIGIGLGYSIIQTPNYDQRSPTVQAPSDFPSRGPIYLSMYETTTTLSDAEKTVGHKISIPAKIPEGLSVKLVKIRLEEKAVRVFIAPMDLNDSMTLEEVMTKKGILILYDPLPPGFDTETWMNKWVAQGAGDFVTVHSTKGVGNDRDPQKEIWSQVYWFDNGIQYNLVADIPLSALLQIAESMPLLQQ
ncbi:MAG: hypothetical protein QXU32_06100 [Nitrososphaerales archaeon]